MKFYFLISMLFCLGSQSLFPMEKSTELTPLLSKKNAQVTYNSLSTTLPEDTKNLLAYLILQLPVDVVAELADYLPGNNYFLNYFLSRRIKPTTKTAQKILRAFMTHLIHKTHPNNPKRIPLPFALEKINLFFKTTKLKHEDDILFHYWDSIRDIIQAIKTYNVNEIHNALEEHLKKYMENVSQPLQVFSNLQEEISFDRFILTCCSAVLKERFSSAHVISEGTNCIYADCWYDNVIKEYWCIKAARNPHTRCATYQVSFLPCLCGIPGLICVLIAVLSNNHTAAVAGGFLLVCTLISCCSSFCALIKECNKDVFEFGNIQAEYKNDVQALFKVLIDAHHFLQEHLEKHTASAQEIV